MSGKRAKDYQGTYDRPELRERLKEEIKASDKGGRPGQWSARKSQLLVQEYEKQGGGYLGARTDEQRSLEHWTEQDWQTREGSAEATGEGEGGSTRRYLPKRAWELLSEEEKRATDRKKQQEGGQDRQFVPNTPAARAARAYVDRGDASGLSEAQLRRLTKGELYEQARALDIPGRSKMDRDELAAAIHEHHGSSRAGARVT